MKRSGTGIYTDNLPGLNADVASNSIFKFPCYSAHAKIAVFGYHLAYSICLVFAHN